MTDFQVNTAVTGEAMDTRWRAGKHGQDAARPMQLDASEFTSGFTVTDGNGVKRVPSGTAVSKLANGKYGPFIADHGEDDDDPQRTLAGYVNDNSGVVLPASGADPTAARLVHGIVNPALLPIAAQRTTVKDAVSTASITYVED